MVENAMKRSEKALAPEWLKGANGGRGITLYHSSSSSQSDDHAISLPTISRSTPVGSTNHDSPRSVVVDRMPTYFRRSSSNDSAMLDNDRLIPLRSSGVFGGNHHERAWNKDLNFQCGDCDISDSLTLRSRTHKDKLRSSQSSMSSKGGIWHRRAGNNTNNGLLPGGSIRNKAQTSTTSQLSVETQTSEELTIRQCRQLIAMISSMPKTSVLDSMEKLKSKTMRSSELNTATKVGQQPSLSQLTNQTVHGTSMSDVSKPSQAGKLAVLRATREMNNLCPAPKDGRNPPNDSRVSLVVQSASLAPLRSPLNEKLVTDCKATALLVTKSSSMDRKSPTQAQNRKNFFNSIRKKTPEMSSVSEQSDDQISATAAAAIDGKDAPASSHDFEWSPKIDSCAAGNGDSHKSPEIFSGDEEKDLSSDAVLSPDEGEDEEEIALLRLMGWEQNAEEAPLTDEEIKSFYELLEQRQPTKLPHGMLQLKNVPFESHIGSSGGAPYSLPSSSDSKYEA